MSNLKFTFDKRFWLRNMSFSEFVQYKCSGGTIEFRFDKKLFAADPEEGSFWQNLCFTILQAGWANKETIGNTWLATTSAI